MEMSLLGISLTLLFSLIAALLIVTIGLIILFFILLKKYPIMSIFVLILISVLGTLEFLTPQTILLGIATWVFLITGVVFQYKRLKKAF